MRNRMKNALALLLAACTLFLCAAGMAGSMHDEVENDLLDMDVEVGFGGMMTYGKTMPVKVKVRNFGDDFEGVLGINAYVSTKEYDRYEKEVFVPGGSQREFELDIAVFSRQDTYTAELLRDGEVVCTANGKPEYLVNPASMLIGVLSTRPQNLNNMNISRENDVLGRYELWQTIPLTADTFPDNAGLLRSFGMLVFDDIDPATLTQKQQDLLDEWLRGGRILLVGGGSAAGRNTAFFSRYTGLKLDEITTSIHVTDCLARLISRTVGGNQPEVTVARMTGADPLARNTDDCGMIFRTQVGGGRIYTAAFEMGDPKLNSENLLDFFWQQLLVDQDQQVYSSVLYASSDNYSPATVTGGYYAEVEAKSHLAAGMLIVLGVLVICCVLWAVLKRKDRRQWMWLMLPVISLFAAVSILLLSGSSETNRPLAVIADNLVQDGSGAIRNYSGISVAVPEYGRHKYSAGSETLRVQNYDYVDYDEEEDDSKRKEPTNLRTCYTGGGENYVSAESQSPWEMINLSAEMPAQIRGKVEGTVWMEEDGLHGEVVNGTDAYFAEGNIVTTYGFASVKALAPGEKAEFVMKRGTVSDPKEPKYNDGFVYLEWPGMYRVIDNAMECDNTKMSAREIRERTMTGYMINGAADVLRSAQNSRMYGGAESALFLYAAPVKDAAETELKADGVPVTQKSSLVMLTAELPFSAVGRTGVVFRSAGMDIPERVETNAKLQPGSVDTTLKQTYYHSLIDNPTFLFTLDGLEGVKVETLQVLVESYYISSCRVYAWDPARREWDEIKANESIRDPGRYLDKSGRLYIQFRSDTQDVYADIQTPMINLEGRLEHAEN